ncbi:hypothetical protein BH11MYX3_BH11MYX3_48780 [soil metagenome]
MHAEVTEALFALQQTLDELVVRGLKATGPDDLARLTSIGDEFGRAGAAYVAEHVQTLVRHVRGDEKGSARALLRTQTVLRVFERVLSIDAAILALGPGEPMAPAAVTLPAVATGDRKALVPILEELARTVEGLIDAGLTTASSATKQKLDASFKEASRMKLLRLAASLRYVGDELARFLSDSEQFSARRLAMFANRSWLITRGLLEAIRENDGPALARLLLTSTPVPVKALRLAVMGAQKRALLDGSAAFEFRMMTLDEQPGVPKGTRLIWSCVFGAKKNVPPEAFPHLPQPQKFLPKLLLDATEILIADAAVTVDEHGYGRVMLGPKSTVKPGKVFRGWSELLSWDREAAVKRLRTHRVSPLDLEVELQVEVVIPEWELGAPEPNPFRPEQLVFPLTAGPLALDVVCSMGAEARDLTESLRAFGKPRAKRPPLFGVMHVEMGRLVLQPLTVFGADGPNYLMISEENIDLASLMKTLDFTS